MAVRVIDLIIKIKEVGIDTLQQVIDKVEELNAVTQTTQTGALGDVAAQAERIASAFDTTNALVDNIDSTISSIEGMLTRAVRSTVQQSVDEATSGIGKIEDNIGRSVEKIYAKVGVGLAGLITVVGLNAKKAWRSALGEFVENFSTLSGVAANLNQYILIPFGELGQMLLNLSTSYRAWIGMVGSSLPKFLGFFAKSITFTSTLSAGLLLGGTILRENVVLARRLVGLGGQSLGPLQRIVRLMTTLDILFSDMHFRWGQMVKSVALAGTAISGFVLNPLLGVLGTLATINSLIDVILNVGQRLRLGVLAWFGDARAQIRLIWLDLRALLFEVVPLAHKFVKEMREFFKMSGQRGLLETFIKFQGTMDGLIVLLGRLLGVVIKVAGITEQELEDVKKDADEFLNGITEKANKAATEIQRRWKKTKAFFKGLFIGLDRIILGPFFLAAGLIVGIFKGIGAGFKALFKRKGPKKDETAKGLEDTKAAADKAGNAVKQLEATTGKAAVNNIVKIREYTQAIAKTEEKYKNIAMATAQATNQQIQAVGKAAGSIMDYNNIIVAATGTVEKFGASTKTTFNQMRTATKSAADNMVSFNATTTSIPDSFNKAASKAGESINGLSNTVRQSVQKIKKEGNIVEFPKQVQKTFAQVKEAVDAPIISINTSIKSVPKEMKQALSTVPKEAKKAFAELPKAAEKELDLLQKSVKLTTALIAKDLKAVFNIQDVLAGMTKGKAAFGGGKGGGAAGSFQQFINMGQQLSKGIEKPLEEVQNRMDKFSKGGLKAFAEQFKSVLPPALQVVASQVKSIKFVDEQKLGDSVKNLDKTVKAAFKSMNLGEVGKDLGTNFTKAFKASYEARAIPEVIALLEAFGELFMSYFPQSPAKRGALKKLPKIGPAVGKQVASGFKGTAPKVESKLDKMTKRMMGYFPYNPPAQFGALRNLSSVGTAMINIIANSIGLNLSFLTGVMDKMVNAMMQPLEEAVELGRFAESLDMSVETLSSMEFAIESVGGSMQDLQTVLVRLNNQIATGINEEQIKKYRNLGINMKEVLQATEPAANLFEQIADQMSKTSRNSEKFQQLLELTSLTGTSKLIPFMRRGAAGMRELQEEGVEMGAVLNTSFVEQAKRVSELTNQFEAFKTSVLLDVLEPLLPKIEELFVKIKAWIKENRQTITVNIMFVVEVLKTLGGIVATVLSEIKNDFEKSFIAVSVLFGAVASFVLESVKDIFDGTQHLFLEMMANSAEVIWALAKNIVGGIFKNLGIQIAIGINKLAQKLFQGISDAFSQIPEDVITVLSFTAVPGLDLAVEGAKKLGGVLEDNANHLEKGLVSIGQIVKDTGDDIAPVFKESGEQFSALINTVADNKPVETMKRNFTKAFEDLKRVYGKDVFGETGEAFTGILEDLDNIASGGLFLEVLDGVKETESAVSRAIKDSTDQAKTGLEAVAGKVKEVGDITSDLLDKNVNQMIIKELEVLTIYDNSLQRQQNLFERNLRIQQEKELEEYIKLQELKFSYVDDEAIEEFKASQRLAREFLLQENIEKLQRESAQKQGQVALELAQLKAALSDEDSDIQAARMLEFEQGQQKRLQSLIDAGASEAQIKEFSRMQQVEKETELQNIIQELQAKSLLAWKATFDSIGQGLSGVGTMFSDLYELSGKSVKEFFIVQKAAQAANIIMSTASAIMQTLAQGGAFAIPQAAIVGAMGAVQLAKVTAQSLGFITGGVVPGQTKGKDHIPAALDGGEYVIKEKVVSKLGTAFFDRVNAGEDPRNILTNIGASLAPISAGVTGFLDGGPGPLAPAPAATEGQPQQNLNVVNVLDSGTLDQLIFSTPGERSLLNFMSNHRQDLKDITLSE